MPLSDTGYVISNALIGNQAASDQLISKILAHARQEEDRARALRLRSRNRFLQRDFENAFKDTVSALHELGVEILEVISLKQADAMFDQGKAELLALGFLWCIGGMCTQRNGGS